MGVQSPNHALIKATQIGVIQAWEATKGVRHGGQVDLSNMSDRYMCNVHHTVKQSTLRH